MFTNWLTNDIESKAKEENSNSTAPDVIIEVGPPPFARFPAHSAILTNQSGYFRAAMFRLSESGKVSENLIYLPNISVEHFTPLLTYMYTGYLELNIENIFGVLLATHLLHMPRALEICRDFLAQTQRQQSEFFSLPLPSVSTSNVIRPIASKASNFGLNFVSPPKAPSNLQLPSVGTKFKTLSGEECAKIPKVSEEKIVAKKIHVKTNLTSESSKTTTAVSESNSNDKVIIDIASCDGPVRFRRVRNEAYESNKHASTSTATAAPPPPTPHEIKYQTNSLSFHQQMVRNINERYSKQKDSIPQNSEESENSQHSIDLYTCVYCNHTFKSKYCYQKHAKRHINPLNPLGRPCRDECESSDGEIKKPPPVIIKRDSIKPLDMNVQYYPCKYCGCKFPSYYFVHKHRKLCHPEVEADGNQSNPIVNNEINEEHSHKSTKEGEDEKLSDV